MPQKRKSASSGARKTASGTAKKATSAAKRTSSSASRTASSAAKRTSSSARRASSSAKRSVSSASAPKKATSAAKRSSKEIGDLTKPELVERLTAELNKLKKDDLVGVIERVEAGSLDLSRLALSGEGGFGFQEHVGDGSERRDDQDDQGSEGLIPRAGDALRGAAEKITEKI